MSVKSSTVNDEDGVTPNQAGDAIMAILNR